MAANVIGDIVVQMKADTAQLRSDLGQVTRMLGGMSGAAASARRALEVFTGIQLHNIVGQLAQLTAEAVKMGRAAVLAEYSFEHFAKQAGFDAANLAAQLHKVSGETINLSDVMAQAARGLRAGLQPEQLLTIMEVARAQSILTGQTVTDAFNDISQAITSQQSRALKAMGIIIDTDEALKKFAKSLGVNVDMLKEAGRQQAFYNAFVEATKGKLIDTNNAVVQQKEGFERLKTSGVDALEAIGKGMLALLGVTVETGKAIGLWLIDKLDQAAAAAERLHAAVRPPGGPGPGIAPGTGMLAALTAPAGGGIAPGTGMLGGPPPTLTPDYIDQEKLRIVQASIASQMALAKATRDTSIAEASAALVLGGNLELIDQQIAGLEAVTKAQIAENRAQYAAKDSLEARGTADVALLKIQTDYTVKYLGLVKQRQDADKEYSDALLRGQREVEGQLEAGALKRIDAFNLSVRQSKDMLRILEGERKAGLPEEGAPPPAVRLPSGQFVQHDVFLQRGAIMAVQDKATRDSVELNKVLGQSYDEIGAKISANTRFIQDWIAAGLDPADEELKKVVADLERLTTIRDSVGIVFDGLRTAFSGMLQGLLQGTQTLSQAFANMGRNIAASLIDSVIKKGLDVLEKRLVQFIDDMQKAGLIQALGKLLGLGISAGVGAAGAGAFNTTGTLAEVPGGGFNVLPKAYQHGGLITRPTLAMMGESGPEAVIPLTGHGMSGPLVEVNVINQAAGTTAESRERTVDGRRIHDIVIREIRQGAAMGELDSMFGSFGGRRVATQR